VFAMRRSRASALGCALLFLLAAGARPAHADADPLGQAAVQARVAAFQARIQESARALANEPSFKGVSAKERNARVEFVVGNMVAVATHEMGHAAISEFNLPVLGREEDAADDYAILTALRLVASEFSYRVLVAAAKGWLLAARRDLKDGGKPNYYDRHGLNEQRAYQIVCMMVGSDPVKFKIVADEYNLPDERRRTCAWDFDTAWQSWNRVLAPHRRAPDQPKTQIEVVYGTAQGELEIFARSFRAVRFLETLAEGAADRYVWPAPFTMEMRTCGEPNARWTIPTRRLHICYEMAQEFAELYREYGRKRKQSRKARR
jgi:Putative metallopeptidase